MKYHTNLMQESKQSDTLDRLFVCIEKRSDPHIKALNCLFKKLGYIKDDIVMMAVKGS